MPMEEWLLNWNNTVKPDRSAMMERAAQKFDELVLSGFSAEQASEILVARGMADNQIATAIKDSRLRLAAGPAPEARPRFPQHYDDVKDHIQALVSRLPAEDLMEILTGGGRTSMAIANFSNRDASNLDAMLRMARTSRNSDPRVMATIHDVLEPHVQNAIIDTEILSREAQEKGNIKIAFAGDRQSAVASDLNGSHRVDLRYDTCTCPRYVLGGFRHLGLVCEHIVEAQRQSAGDNWSEVAGMKKVFAQKSQEGRRIGWCVRASREIDINASCIEAECPFFCKDDGDHVVCSFATR